MGLFAVNFRCDEAIDYRQNLTINHSLNVASLKLSAEAVHLNVDNK